MQNKKKEYFLYILYNVSNQLPNLLLIPLISARLPPEKTGYISTILITVGLFSLLSEWGSLSIGAQQLKKTQRTSPDLISHIEMLRIMIAVFLCGMYLFLVNDAIEWLLVCIGLSTSVIHPTWVIIGLGLELNSIKYVLATRCLQMLSTLYTVYRTENQNLVCLVYYLVLLIGLLGGRKLVLNHCSINLRPKFYWSAIKAHLISGFYVTIGGGMAYVITSGAPIILKGYLQHRDIAVLAIAERILTCFRTIIGMVLQKSFINNDDLLVWNTDFKIRYTAGMFLILVLGEVVVINLSKSETAAWCYLVMWFGFSVIGVSHKNVTLGMLGRNKIRLWFQTIAYGFVTYLATIALVVRFSTAGIAVKIALCTMVSEFAIMILGLRRDNEHI